MRKELEPKAGFSSAETVASPETKKPYQPPRLAVYGDLRHLALAKNGRRNDGKGLPTTRV